MPNGKKDNDIFMKPVKATFGLGDTLVTSTVKGMDNIAKGFSAGFGKGLHKK